MFQVSGSDTVETLDIDGDMCTHSAIYIFIWYIPKPKPTGSINDDGGVSLVYNILLDVPCCWWNVDAVFLTN